MSEKELLEKIKIIITNERLAAHWKVFKIKELLEEK